MISYLKSYTEVDNITFVTEWSKTKSNYRSRSTLQKRTQIMATSLVLEQGRHMLSNRLQYMLEKQYTPEKPKFIRSIYFDIRDHHRIRQRETVDSCPPSMRILRPIKDEFEAETNAMFAPASRMRRLKIWFLLTFFPLCIRPMRQSKLSRCADIIFTWAVIPLRARRGFIVEFENPYQICMYQVGWMRFLRPVIRLLLGSKRCKAIACLSEACRKGIEAELGADIAAKAIVTYPFISNSINKRLPYAGEKLEFLFVATLFRHKGGLETANAFNRVANAMNGKIHLTMVTNIDDALAAELARPGHIRFVKSNLSREVLHQDFFAKSDVFILPSSQDSSPMVILEAISFGLPVIASRVYAVPEMVTHGKNGFLIDPGFDYFTNDFKANVPYWRPSGMQKAVSIYYPRVEEDLILPITMLANEDVRKSMSVEAAAIYQEKFSNKVREENFLKLFRCGSN